MNLPAYEINGEPVSADRFYAVACDPRRHIVVQACAGAGKTWMLVSRLLRALLDGAQPREIMAITFTRKAAGEMRSRLLEWLQAFHGADLETCRAELRSRGVDESEIAREGACSLPQALSMLYQRVLDQGAGLRISTFHAWFAELLRAAPLGMLHALGLPADYELIDDDEELRKQHLRHWRASLTHAPDLLADYRHLALNIGTSSLEKALDAALQRRIELQLAERAGVVEGSLPHWRTAFPEMAAHASVLDWLWDDATARTTLLQAAAAMGRWHTDTMQRLAGQLEKGVGANDWDAAQAALLTQKLEPRKLPGGQFEVDAVVPAQQLAVRVIEAQRQQQGWEHQQRMARLARHQALSYAEFKRAQGAVDMNDIEAAALAMMTDPVVSGWVQERLDAQLRHLLIDEFQDTNPLQWQALQAWLAAYSGAARAPSLFIVGDPKQSIYRFRRAEPQVFVAAQDFVRQGLGGDVLTCDHTRRTAPGLLDVINQVMEQAQQQGQFQDFRRHTTSHGEGGVVQRLPLIARPPSAPRSKPGESPALQPWRYALVTPYLEPEDSLHEQEARQAADWIADELASGRIQRPRQVMVLARKRVALEPLRDALRQRGVPVQMGDRAKLADACEVQDVLALLDALLLPDRNAELARALKSPLLGQGDAELVALALAQRANSTCSWFDLLSITQLRMQDGRALADVLKVWQGWLAQWPVHDALQAIYDDGDVLARYAQAAPGAERAAVLANLQALLHAALALQGARGLTPYGWVRAVKVAELKVPTLPAADAVQLLTVHGAKGLEADVVLLLDSHPKDQTGREGYGVLVDWPAQNPAPSHFIFVPRLSDLAPSVVPLLEADRAHGRREELNALYVAMTRARQRLVLSAIARKADEPEVGEAVPPDEAASASWWQRMAPLAQPVPVAESPNAVSDTSVAAGSDVTQIVMPDLPPAPVQSAGGAPETIATEAPASDAARMGEAMHRMLQWRRWDDAAQRATSHSFGLTSAQAAQAARWAQTIRYGEGAWAWDAAQLQWQADELELLHQGQLLRLDRLVRRAPHGSGDEGKPTWWVLDYKSSARPQDDPTLLSQLRRYRTAVQDLHTEEPVCAAFLSADGRLHKIEP